MIYFKLTVKDLEKWIEEIKKNNADYIFVEAESADCVDVSLAKNKKYLKTIYSKVRES